MQQQHIHASFLVLLAYTKAQLQAVKDRTLKRICVSILSPPSVALSAGCTHESTHATTHHFMLRAMALTMMATTLVSMKLGELDTW